MLSASISDRQYLEWNNYRRKSEICCRWLKQSHHFWYAINVFGIVAYINPNLDYIPFIKIPQPGYTDRLEDDTLSNKRYSAAWEKISLISILHFLQPSETLLFLWLWHSCDSCVPVHPQYGKTSCVQPFDVADVMIPKYFFSSYLAQNISILWQ